MGLLSRLLHPPRRLSRYEHLIELAVKAQPRSLLEIGVWRGDRGEQFLSSIPTLGDYVGLDLFEGMDSQTFTQESMGRCYPTSVAEVETRLLRARRNPSATVRLVRGRTDATMPVLARERPASFDFIYLDGGHSLETVESDWTFSVQLIRPGGIVVFDDYYLNDDTRGAKPLVDRLARDRRYRVRFFPVVEDIVEDLQITMVSVQAASVAGEKGEER